MRAGRLDQTITLRSVTYEDDGYGGQVPVETDFADLRAQIIEESTDEFVRNYGVSTERLRIFRTRWLDGVTLDMTVVHDGRSFNLKQIKEIGRRRGLELRCSHAGP
ncbi:MAG: phage head closure protein [Aquamicrobium sp.]|uniref:phage head closure protein n=1 Tax=Aquamicrobium sp. TaxID=1872579 RepID=UPI00349E9CC7|nr:phage head closure protein [Aquamicrobium sp.]MCO5158957.1 phage head closure protein [Aquamicrobium sp.]